MLRILRWTAAGLFWGFAALAGLVAWFAWDLPDTRQVAMPELRPAITIVAADGSTITRYGDLRGDVVPVAALPDHLIEAVLAIEDRRFYDHVGVDPIGILRAAWVNWRAGATLQGGSTISQQTAKNLFLTPERSLRRKVQEALLAIWLELNYSKDQILTAYLNRVYFGSGTYGVDAASQAFFGVPATEVNLRQAAILAGVLKAPSRYSPLADPEAAEARAEVVLDAMVDAGFLTEAERAAAGRAPPVPSRRPGGGPGARYFADWIAGQVPDFAGRDLPDLIVHTTLDPVLQRLAEEVVAARLAADGGEAGASQAALVAMRPDGAVLAMVGGRSYSESQFNRAASALRQPGSAFKTFVYLSAIEQGLIGPDSAIEDTPIRIGDWEPGNFDERFHGTVSVREAFAKSYNTAAVRVLQAAGIDHTVDLLRRLGFTTPIVAEPSLALGTSEVTLVELVQAYAVLANGGRGIWGYGIETILARDGTEAYRRTGGGLGEVVLPWHVRTMNGLLAAVMTDGTGRSAALAGRPSAGKTGTSQGHRDAWFVGFTGELVVGVWVGNDDGRPMNRVTGGSLPAAIWHDFVAAALDGRPVTPIPGLDGGGPAVLPTPVDPLPAGSEDAIAAILENGGTGLPVSVRWSEPVPVPGATAAPPLPMPPPPAPTGGGPAVVLRPFAAEAPTPTPTPLQPTMPATGGEGGGTGSELDRLLDTLIGG